MGPTLSFKKFLWFQGDVPGNHYADRSFPDKACCRRPSIRPWKGSMTMNLDIVRLQLGFNRSLNNG